MTHQWVFRLTERRGRTRVGVCISSKINGEKGFLTKTTFSVKTNESRTFLTKIPPFKGLTKTCIKKEPTPVVLMASRVGIRRSLKGFKVARPYSWHYRQLLGDKPLCHGLAIPSLSLRCRSCRAPITAQPITGFLAKSSTSAELIQRRAHSLAADYRHSLKNVFLLKNQRQADLIMWWVHFLRIWMIPCCYFIHHIS